MVEAGQKGAEAAHNIFDGGRNVADAVNKTVEKFIPKPNEQYKDLSDK